MSDDPPPRRHLPSRRHPQHPVDSRRRGRPPRDPPTDRARWLIALGGRPRSDGSPPHGSWSSWPPRAPLTAFAGEASAPATEAVRLAAPPDETCLPQSTGAQVGFDVCSPPGAGTGGSGGGFNLGGLLPILAALVVGAGLALVVVVSRPSAPGRRAARPRRCRRVVDLPEVRPEQRRRQRPLLRLRHVAGLRRARDRRGSCRRPAKRARRRARLRPRRGSVRAIRSRARKYSPTTGRNHGRPSYGARTSGKRSFDERRRLAAAHPLGRLRAQPVRAARPRSRSSPSRTSRRRMRPMCGIRSNVIPILPPHEYSTR